MVSFPATTRQRAAAAVVAIALAAVPTAVPSAHADDLKHRKHKFEHLKHKKHKVEHRIRSAKADLEESSHAAYRAQQALSGARSQLSAARKRLATTQGRLTAAEALDRQTQAELVEARAALDQARADLAAGRRKVRDQHALLSRMASESMQQADPRLIGLWAMLRAQNPADLTTQLKTVGNLMDREHGALEDLKTARTLLTVKERKVQEARDEVAAKRKAAAENLVLRKRLEKEAAANAASVADLVVLRRQAREASLRAKHADQRTLHKLKRQNAKIERMLAARAHHAVGHGNGGGPLLRPVTGYVTSPFGWRIHPIYHYWGLHDGTDFHAPCGTPLRAAGNGRVISEYFNSAWGNRLILDLGRVRGHGVAVIYNHISAYRVHTGASVSRGSTVAYAGTTGWSTACHLHFTVMVDGKAQNPMNWF